jgi:Ca-activated chloride channel family protein
MLLRGSKFNQNSQFDQLSSIAKSAKEKDDEGYLAEFIRIESTKNMMRVTALVVNK